MTAAFGRPASFCLISCLAFLFMAGTATASDAKIRLLFFSSHPEIMQPDDTPGLANLATAVQEAQQADTDSYLIYGGASLGPSLLGVLDKGAHMIDILNGLQPEFMAVMKREFSYGLDHLALNAHASAFPLISSSLIDARTGDMLEGTEPYYLLVGNEMNIGFIALTSHNAVIEYGITDAYAIDMDEVVDRYVSELHDQGADAIFLIADTDYDDLSRYRKSGKVDGIFYAHNFGNPYSLDHHGTLHTPGALDSQLIVLDIARDPDGVVKSQASFLNLGDFAPDPVVNSLIQSYKSRLSERLSLNLAKLGTSFDTLRANVRKGENAFGNFAADALRHYAQTDVFLLNSGAIRGNRTYSAGSNINRGDIQRELPFGNRIAAVKLSGSELKRTLEYGIDCFFRADGCGLQVSNLSIRYDRSAPMGSRITKLTVGGKDVTPDAVYSVGMSDFMADGNDGFTWLMTAERSPSNNLGRTIWDLLAAYCEDARTIHPKIEGRIQGTGQTD